MLSSGLWMRDLQVAVFRDKSASLHSASHDVRSTVKGPAAL